MTVSISKTQIHLGWPAAASIILFLVVITWRLGICFNGFINAQHEMQRQLSLISKRDSVYYSKVDSQMMDMLTLRYRQDSLRNEFNLFKRTISN
jgi:hypothetical protein